MSSGKTTVITHGQRKVRDLTGLPLRHSLVRTGDERFERPLSCGCVCVYVVDLLVRPQKTISEFCLILSKISLVLSEGFVSSGVWTGLFYPF